MKASFLFQIRINNTPFTLGIIPYHKDFKVTFTFSEHKQFQRKMPILYKSISNAFHQLSNKNMIYVSIIAKLVNILSIECVKVGVD